MTIDAGSFPVSQEAAFAPEEENILKARMFTLLSKQVRLRTQGDHSSLREEDAAELLDSLLFTLRYQLYLQGLPLRTLLTADLNALLRDGQAALQTCVDGARALYGEALADVKSFGSRSLSDTLKGIGLFFRAYDLRLYAHRIPAEIDYQLCLPVAEGLRGALYIKAYLERLLTENKLVTRFAPERVSALLFRVLPDYRELLINLCEPVAANAVGLALLRCDLQPLRITPRAGGGDSQWLSVASACRRPCTPPGGCRRRVRYAGTDRCAIHKRSSADRGSFLSKADHFSPKRLRRFFSQPITPNLLCQPRAVRVSLIEK